MMKTPITAALALAVACCAVPALASSHREAPLTGQQSKMASCNQEAGDKKGDERKAFMSGCLSAKKETQQDKMKSCNADAKGKKGDERKTFMSECLSNKS
jgi:hypothetical protein